MCGIVGAVAERNVVPILLQGLARLEYRGYDSAGIAVLDDKQRLQRFRTTQKVQHLEFLCGVNATNRTSSQKIKGLVGIAHTRWATHGGAVEKNAHPHIANDQLALVHNGILENFSELKQACLKANYSFCSDTDSEVILALIAQQVGYGKSLEQSLMSIKALIKGAFSLGAINTQQPNQAVAYRQGSPLIIGIGFEEYYFASDINSILPVTQNYIALEEGDLAVIETHRLVIKNDVNEIVYDSRSKSHQQRPIISSKLRLQATDKGQHRHFMHKEIFEQPQTCRDTLVGYLGETKVLVNSFGASAEKIFTEIERIQIIACGTSYHAGMIFKYWCEDIVRIPVDIEVASEYRYRNPVISNKTLIVAISQSGETADTLAALKLLLGTCRQLHFNNPILAICNNAESSLVGLSELNFITHAGPEIGVASTKAFTTQLIALALLLIALGSVKKRLDSGQQQTIVEGLRSLPELIQQALHNEPQIAKLAMAMTDSQTIIFLGRGSMYPVAMEGALKLKEISYIHAEAFPAGELKHGPLALVDKDVPVVVLAPNDELLSKLKSNLEEVSARGGRLFVFQDHDSEISTRKGVEVINVSKQIGRISAPILMTIPLQLLAYHVALNRGTDIDQPRNLAKAVTVE